MGLEPLADKWRAFGWHVITCNGHDHEDIIKAYNRAVSIKGKPSVILARTVMGKGIRSIEGDHRWHGRAPTMEEAERFVREVDS
jgi:transketolase